MQLLFLSYLKINKYSYFPPSQLAYFRSYVSNVAIATYALEDDDNAFRICEYKEHSCQGQYALIQLSDKFVSRMAACPFALKENLLALGEYGLCVLCIICHKLKTLL